jgi:hypothetical protein
MEKIEAFRTTGGQVFTDENKAREAQALEDLRAFWSRYGYSGMDKEGAMEVSHEHAGELLRLLNSLTTTAEAANRDAVILTIGKQLGFDTLDTCNSDHLDFKEVAVWKVKEALEAAYLAGQLSIS